VESEFGVGTTFAVVIPARYADATRDEARKTTEPRRVATENAFVEEATLWLPNRNPPSTTTPRGRDELPGVDGDPLIGRVLVVDDNADMRDYLARVLSKHWTVETAVDGTIALALLRNHRPDLVLTDIMMPNLDGFGLIAALRAAEATADIPVIMLSARAGEESRIEGLRAGADDYLIKPFSARELVARVQVHLTLAQLRRKLLERAVQARQAAEQATRAKDEFLAMLGHELRNPLSPIVMAVQLMKQHGANGTELRIIERQLRQLVRLVDDLLDVSRITRGKVELQREPVAVAEVMTRAVETASPLLEQRGQPLDLNVPDDLSVNGDPTRLAQVFANLLTNASKYSDPGTPIRVSARAIGDRVEIRTRDLGIGIRPELLERVFDLFVQQPQSLDRSAGGLGLGLAIVKNLVSSHGGTVRVESAGSGMGSEFIVELPLFSAEGGEQLDASATDENAPERARTIRRVLVVDDNEDGAEMLGRSLASMGHRVRVAHDGMSALDTAAKFHPEVALLDIGLPVMNGYELAGRLREMPGGHDIRLVAVTGYGQAGDRDASRAAGFSDHVVKPVDIESLGNIIA
jgi:signal transduction histidine kinase